MATKLITVEAKQIEGYKIKATCRDHIAMIDQPEASGGTNTGITPLEYLFVSLASCIVTIGHIVAKQQQLNVKGIEVKVEGDLNPDVFLGKTKEVRAGFSSIRVYTKINADMTKEEKERFIQEVDDRCPISDNVLNLTPVEFFVE